MTARGGIYGDLHGDGTPVGGARSTLADLTPADDMKMDQCCPHCGKTPEQGPSVEGDELRETLEWIAEIASKEYERDHKLRADGARTLKRIADKALVALSLNPST